MRHAIQAIVTGKAGIAKILSMLGDESRIMLPMTKEATLRCKSKIWLVGKMTFLTGHQRRVIIYLMPDQAKASSGMIEKRQGGGSDVKIPSAMVGVAIGALFGAQTGAMQPRG